MLASVRNFQCVYRDDVSISWHAEQFESSRSSHVSDDSFEYLPPKWVIFVLKTNCLFVVTSTMARFNYSRDCCAVTRQVRLSERACVPPKASLLIRAMAEKCFVEIALDISKNILLNFCFINPRVMRTIWAKYIFKNSTVDSYQSTFRKTTQFFKHFKGLKCSNMFVNSSNTVTTKNQHTLL